MSYQIKRWESFQHYRQRKPPWIKLHRSLLDDYVFSKLPDSSRALAPCLWLLASESENGTVPSDHDELAYRLRQATAWIDKAIKPLIDNGFLICSRDADDTLAPCNQEPIAETEREIEKETYKTREREARPKGVADVDAFILEQGFIGVTGQQFMDYYDARGWKHKGGQPVKDWKASLRSWPSIKGVKKNLSDKLSGNTSDPNRPCAYCGGPYPCKCYEEA